MSSIDKYKNRFSQKYNASIEYLKEKDNKKIALVIVIIAIILIGLLSMVYIGYDESDISDGEIGENIEHVPLDVSINSTDINIDDSDSYTIEENQSIELYADHPDVDRELSYTWRINEEEHSGKNITYDYTTDVDEYTIELHVDDPEVDRQYNDYIQINTDEIETNILAHMSVSENNVEEGTEIEFDGSDSSARNSDIESYEWNFDNGETGTGDIVNYSYTEDGEYSVELTVTNSEGEQDTYTTDIIVSEETHDLTINVNDEEGNSIESDIEVDNMEQTGSSTTFNLSSGEYTVTVDAEDYEEHVEEITINGDKEKDIVLEFQGVREIHNWYDLDDMRNDLDSEYILVTDLDSNTEGYDDVIANSNFTPIGENNDDLFKGNFDGQGNTIHNLKITNDGSNFDTGLFSQNSGEISNINLRDVDIDGGDSRTGALVGQSSGDIDNVYVDGYITGEGSVGGIAGVLNTISNSNTDGTIEGHDNVGGIAGFLSGSATDSYTTGDVNGNHNIGGLFGNIRDGGEITDSYTTGEVTGKDYVGGLVGDNGDNDDRVRFIRVYSEGDVSGENYVGGLIGDHRRGEVRNSYAEGDVSGIDYVGGLIGENWSDNIDNTYATGTVSGNDYVGGLVGYQTGDIIDSYATGTVSGSNDVGGAVGWFNSFDMSNTNIDNIYATGSVTGDEDIGGLIGRTWSETHVTESYATGDVTVNDYRGGGLVGMNSGDISDSYATGNVNGDDMVAGLIGRHHEGSVSTSYSVGSVSGQERTGGIIGLVNEDGTTDNIYWDMVSSDMDIGIGEDRSDNDENVIGLESNEMQGDSAEDTMSELDFTSTWSITNEYPELQWE